jgi:DNA-binding IclR family transcriptional regulator
MPRTFETERFISSTFRSVWALELLLFLRRTPQTAHDHEALIRQLRASDSVVTKSIESLVAAGLIVEHGDGSVSYSPASPDLEAGVMETENLYRVRPDAVRRLIIASSAGGLAAFADAFRLKGD